MKVIKEGKEHLPKKYIVKCWKCGSILEYTYSDIRQGQYNEEIVICPICHHYVDHDYKNEVKD